MASSMASLSASPSRRIGELIALGVRKPGRPRKAADARRGERAEWHGKAAASTFACCEATAQDQTRSMRRLRLARGGSRYCVLGLGVEPAVAGFHQFAEIVVGDRNRRIFLLPSQRSFRSSERACRDLGIRRRPAKCDRVGAASGGGTATRCKVETQRSFDQRIIRSPMLQTKRRAGYEHRSSRRADA